MLGNLSLGVLSPCIDRGGWEPGRTVPPTDLDGLTREVDTVGEPNLGDPATPFLDMGALEFYF